MGLISPELITKIITSASSAPSGDNSQPWRFVVRNNIIEFHYLPEKDNAILNYENSGTLIALGASIKNAELEALALGYNPKIKYIQNGSCVATMELQEGGRLKKGELQLHEAIFKRHSNRKAYRKIALDEESRTAILNLFSSNEYGIGAVLLESKDVLQKTARALTTMEEVALGNQKLHELFFKDILWSESENREGKNGMYIKTLELPPPAQFLFRFLKNWSFARTLAKIGFPKLVAKTNAKQNASASAFGVVVVRRADRETYLNIGKFIEHVWLLATAHGLSFQIVTGMVFLERTMKDESTKNIFSDKERKLVDRSYDLVKKYVGGIGEPIIVFRLGTSSEPTDISYRTKPDISFVK